jgi:hypothetical protein
MMSLNNVAVKARPLIDSEHAVHTANNATDGATDNSTNRACCLFALAGTAFDASGYALSGSDRRNKQRRCKQRTDDNLFYLISSYVRERTTSQSHLIGSPARSSRALNGSVRIRWKSVSQDIRNIRGKHEFLPTGS